MKFAFAVAFLSSLGGSIVFGDSCGSFRDARGRSSVDVAPLPGFVDVCSRDFQLCVMLTQGYPPSVQTIAYFVPIEEWDRYQKSEHKGFSRYLIAQKGKHFRPSDSQISSAMCIYSRGASPIIPSLRRFSSRVARCRWGSSTRLQIRSRLALL